MHGSDVPSIADAAARLESQGHGAMWSVEAQHDPFLPLVVAATATTQMRLGTNIAVAFARSPMTVALAAHDLQRLSGGRFLLGLGPQVKAHVERRYSMPWSHPAARMHEYVLALRAIWTAWEEGSQLRFEGEFYRHTLMGPNFDPGPSGYGPPPIYLAGVGPLMTAVAGEAADGLLCHPLTTPEYLSAVTLPALAKGRSSRRSERDFAVVVSMLAATGSDDESLRASLANVRRKIAFYVSTPAYRPMLDVHGLGYLQAELNDLARQGRWDEMAEHIDDHVLARFAVVGSPAEIGRTVRERYDGLADRVALYELDRQGRLLLTGRHLAETGPLADLMAGFRRPRRT